MNDVATVDLSTGEIVSRGDGAVVRFKPETAVIELAALEAGQKLAAKMGDREGLEIASDKIIDVQEKFVAWWSKTVRGKGKRRNVTDPAHFVSEATAKTGISKKQVSRWSGRLKDRGRYRDQLVNATWTKAMGQLDQASQMLQQSLSNEHYTPAKYIEAARSVLGAIDLDPASCAEAQRTVKASEYFTAEHSGLDVPWHGRVWMNPPYGGLAPQFVEKMMTEILAERVTAAVVLVNSHCTDAGWFKPLWDGLLCFTDHRIDFFGGDSIRSGSTHGSVFSYFGQERELFVREFSQFGPVLERIRV